MSEVTCVNRQEPPEDFHHGPEEEREPCRICGSTARRFLKALGDVATASDRIVVTRSVSTSWRTFGQRRPEAETTRKTVRYEVRCERLADTWMIDVFDESGGWLGGGVADDAQDLGLAAGEAIADAQEDLSDD